MSSTAFTNNHRDHSNETGYQFEFFCDKCGNGHRSSFQASALGVGSKILQGLGSLFGGSKLGNMAGAADHMKDGLRGSAWDAAFKKAIEELKPRFRQCTRCGQWVCPEVCWNEQRQLCEGCAPDLAEEAAHHQATVQSWQVREKMMQTDMVADVDVKADMLAACPHCQARLVPGAKFCAGCGKAVGAAASKKVFCTGCGTTLPPGGKFCASCGTAAP
jgi:hypothetical protein